MLKIVEIFTEALTAGHIKRAVEIASVMDKSAKTVAREIWNAWKDLAAGKDLSACPF